MSQNVSVDEGKCSSKHPSAIIHGTVTHMPEFPENLPAHMYNKFVILRQNLFHSIRIQRTHIQLVLQYLFHLLVRISRYFTSRLPRCARQPSLGRKTLSKSLFFFNKILCFQLDNSYET